MESEQMRLVYQDQQILVLHKPCGWTIYEEEGVPKSQQLHTVCKEMFMEDLHPVHRLDRPTCGLVVFAGSGRWARLLQEQFMSREVKKTYFALVHGHLKGSRIIDIKLKDRERGELTAVTKLKAIATGMLKNQPVTFVELMPETGRFHQLRKHCKLIEHPIVGDMQYGLLQADKLIQKELPLRLMLSATRLSFIQPKTKKNLNLTDHPDQSFQDIVKATGIKGTWGKVGNDIKVNDIKDSDYKRSNNKKSVTKGGNRANPAPQGKGRRATFNRGKKAPASNRQRS